MVPDEGEITPLQAIHYYEDYDSLVVYCEQVGLPIHEMRRRVREAYARATPDDHETYRWLIDGREPFVGIPENPHRHDAEELARFVEASPWLPRRLRQVFELCIEDGLTLAQCGARLGISRETVRRHLRRLRVLMQERPQVIDSGRSAASSSSAVITPSSSAASRSVMPRA